MAEIRCGNCGQLNRVGSLAAGKKAICGKCKAELAEGAGPLTATDASFDSIVGKGAVVVDFWAAWCGPCQVIAPAIEAMAASRNDVRFAKLNIDENPRTAARFMVNSIPTLIFFENGAEKDRMTGAAARPHIERWIANQLRS